MKTALLLHGICDQDEFFNFESPALSNAHWFPWLQKRLCCFGTLCQAIEMPKPFFPKYEDWKKTFEQIDYRNLSLVIGHSAGCGFILRWLAENPDVGFGRLILVAPWLDPKKEMGDFLKFELDYRALRNVGETHLLFSEDDSQDVIGSMKLIMKEYPHINLVAFENMGHFCMEKFPEIWEFCK